MKDEDGNDIEDKPRWISEDLPLYHISKDKATSTKRAKVFDPDNHLNGDFAQMIEAPVTVTIVHNPKKGDPNTVYVNVGNVTPPMKGFPVPELKNPPKVLDLDAPDLEIFASLPDWLQEKIKGNLNYNGSLLQRALEGEPAAGKVPDEPEVPVEEADAPDDDSWGLEE
jgi:hypothetical protein